MEEFKVAYERYNRPIYKFFANLGFTREESRDLTQETFLEVYRSAASFRGKSSISTWIFAVAKKVWLQARRDRGRLKRNAEELSLDELTEAGRLGALQTSDKDPAREHEPLEDLLEEERLRLLRGAIADLPERMRLCVLLTYVQGRKSSEIAAVLRISEGAVRSQLSQARERLREMLAEHFPDIL